MNKAQVIHRHGPPDVMKWQDWHLPDPAPGEVRLRHTAVGVNFADTYHRGGVSHPWKVDTPPVVIGFEGVGVVEGVGDGVNGFKVGDRVAYGIPPWAPIQSQEITQPISYFTCPMGLMTGKWQLYS